MKFSSNKSNSPNRPFISWNALPKWLLFYSCHFLPSRHMSSNKLQAINNLLINNCCQISKKSYCNAIHSKLNNSSSLSTIIYQIMAKSDTLSALTFGHIHISLPIFIMIVIYLYSLEPY